MPIREKIPRKYSIREPGASHIRRFSNLVRICPFRLRMSNYRVLQGSPPRGRQLYFTSPSASDPLFKASKAPFLTLRVTTRRGHPVKHHFIEMSRPLQITPRSSFSLRFGGPIAPPRSCFLVAAPIRASKRRPEQWTTNPCPI